MWVLGRTNIELDSVPATVMKMMDMVQDIHGAAKLCSWWNNKYLVQQIMNHTIIRTISQDAAKKHKINVKL